MISPLFWSKVDKNGPIPQHAPHLGACWVWLGAKVDGYGSCSKHVHGAWLAHRVTYEGLVGPVPQALQLDHLCRNRACCNPTHLEPVTRLVNVRRGEAGKRMLERTHCPYGHPYAGSNVYVSPAGKRDCVECRRARGRRYHARKSA